MVNTMTPMKKAKERVRAWTSGPLDLSWLGLTELPELPTDLEILYCSNNQLRILPDTLPAGLIHLDCHKNQLRTLPDTLPASLRVLCCSHNRLMRISDTLPVGLLEFACSNNQLTWIPDTLPTGLITIILEANNFPYEEFGESFESIYRPCECER
jgi:Leucine-rich repeat (LRR) protein